MCRSEACTIQLVLMSGWLLQLDKFMDLQLDGAVRQHFHHKPSSSSSSSSSSLFFTSQSSSSRLPMSSPPSSLYLCSSLSPHLAACSSFPTNPLPPPSPQLLSVLYCVGTAWVSPPEVCSCIRLPEAGRLVPVAQLKNNLQETRKLKQHSTHVDSTV